MGNTIEVEFKKWLKVITYAGALILFFGGIFNLYNVYVGEFRGLPDLLSWFLIGTAVFGLIVGGFLIVHFRRFRIVLHPDKIESFGLYDITIPYETVERIHVGKDMIQVRGNGWFNKIPLGNLYTNFDAATQLLAKNFQPTGDIEFTGNDKYIEKYFGREEVVDRNGQTDS